jgi:transcriptional regulator with XRE-family HTH domain
MHTAALVELALAALSCSQKELAKRLRVSPTQISKWKNEEHMSEEMEKKLRALAKIGDKDPELVLWAGSPAGATKWERLIRYLAEAAQENEETGYDTYPLLDGYGSLCWSTLHVLREMGVTLPKEFPEELDIDYEEADDAWELLDENPYSALISNIYKSLTDVYGFYAAYLSELMNDEKLELYEGGACNIESELIALAACKIDVNQEFAPKIRQFRHRVRTDYEEWLNIVKDRAFREGVPLRGELVNLVYDSHDELGQEAERESLGFNASRVHPDIYMNELLVGMRVIHQVLPAILTKLGIEEEFALDTSELRVGPREAPEDLDAARGSEPEV